MKCLSISQPFADLIILGKKTIELRSWNTKYRGDILVHAPIKIRHNDIKRLKITKKLDVGVLVGKVEIYDVKKYQTKKEIKNDATCHFSNDTSMKKYGFLLRNAKPLRVPIPYKGRLGLFEAILPKNKIKTSTLKSEIIDEEYRYQWIGHH